MKLYYNGLDITPCAEIREAVMDDRLGAECDSLRLRLGNHKEWLAWQPCSRDTVEVRENGYTSGVLYIDEQDVRKDGYSLYARSLPKAAEEKAWESYQNVRLWELLRMAAGRMGMEYAVYGTGTQQYYRYLKREQEGWMSFLNRLAVAEDMKLKASGGKLLIIDNSWISAQPCIRQYTLTDTMENWKLEKAGTKTERLRIVSPFGEGFAADSAAGTDVEERLVGLPIHDALQAKRWALGILTERNEANETLTMWIALDTGIAASARVGITGIRAAEGEWLAHRVEHDFFGRKTTLTLRREVRTVS